MKLVARLRGESKVKNSIAEEGEKHEELQQVQRDRSKSLCVERLTSLLRPGCDPTTIVARELNLHNLQRRRASSALSSGQDFVSRRGVFSRRHYGSVELLPQVESDGQDATGRRFRVETGDSLGEKEEMGLFGSPSTPVLENPEYQTRWYFKYFLGKPHQNYVGADEHKVPFFLSVVITETSSQNDLQYRAILWKKTGAQKISLSSTRNKPVIVKQILSNFPNMEKLDKGPKEIFSPDIQKDLLLLEEQEGSVNFKFGILYALPSQTTDDEMFSNEAGSPEFEKFLSLLGDRIRLKGFDRYRGGLDVKGDMTGKYSVYTIYEGHEIMFHVSTMLPYSKDNKQQVERKRHIGNDIVNIIFLDGPPTELNHFNPSFIKSQFTHIFAVVTYVPEDSSYRLAVYSEESVPIFGPSLPCPPVFRDSAEFREFLLVKMINGEKSAFNTPTFAQKRERTLDMLIKDLYSEYMNEGKGAMLSRRAFSDVIMEPHCALKKKEEARQDEFVRIGQSLKVYTIVKGDAPTSLATTGLFRRAPWEPHCFYPDFAQEIISGDSWSDSRLIVATDLGVFLLDDKPTQRLIFDKTVTVKQLSVVEAHGILLMRIDKGKDGKIYVFRLSDFESEPKEGAQPRCKHDIKEHRLERTKGCHLYAVSRPGNSHLRMVVAIGKKLLLMQWRHSAAWTAWCPTSDTDTVDGFQYIREIQVCEAPVLMTLVDSSLSLSAGGNTNNYICLGYRHQFDLVNEKSGDVSKLHSVEGHKIALVAAVDLYEDEEPELLLCYNHTCHFQKIGEENIGSDFDFHWNSVPTSVVCAFPYVIAFDKDSMEIRLIINGNLIQTMIMPKLSLICSKSDIFFATTAPEFFSNKVGDDANNAKAELPSSQHSGSPEAKPLRIYKISLQSLSGSVSACERRCPTPSNSTNNNSDDKLESNLVHQDSSGNLLPPEPGKILSRSCSSSPTPH